jgi:hypothetical protein
MFGATNSIKGVFIPLRNGQCSQFGKWKLDIPLHASYDQIRGSLSEIVLPQNRLITITGGLLPEPFYITSGL